MQPHDALVLGGVPAAAALRAAPRACNASTSGSGSSTRP